MFCQHLNVIYHVSITNSRISLIPYQFKDNEFQKGTQINPDYEVDKILHVSSIVSHDFGLPLMHFIVSHQNMVTMVYFWNGIFQPLDIPVPITEKYHLLDGPSIVSINDKTILHRDNKFEDVTILYKDSTIIIFKMRVMEGEDQIKKITSGGVIQVVNIENSTSLCFRDLYKSMTIFCPIDLTNQSETKQSVTEFCGGDQRHFYRAHVRGSAEFVQTLTTIPENQDSSIDVLKMITEGLYAIHSQDGSLVLYGQGVNKRFKDVADFFVFDFVGNGSIQIAILTKSGISWYDPFIIVSDPLVSVLSALKSREQVEHHKLRQRVINNDIKRGLLRSSHQYDPIKNISIHQTEDCIFYKTGKDDLVPIPIRNRNALSQTQFQVVGDHIVGKIQTNRLGKFYYIKDDKVFMLRSMVEKTDTHDPLFESKYYVKIVNQEYMRVLGRFGHYTLVGISNRTFIANHRQDLIPYVDLQQLYQQTEALLTKMK